MSRAMRRFGQPTSLTHPHLLKDGEVTVGIQAAEYAARRRRFFDLLPNGAVAVLPGAVRPRWTNDILWPFRQESNMWFLTGFEEPNAVAVFSKSRNGVEAEDCFAMFCPVPTPHSELWDGPRAGIDGCKSVFGAKEAYPRDTLASMLANMFLSSGSIFFHQGVNPAADAEVAKAMKKSGVPMTALSLAKHFNELRAVKSPAQQAMLQRSADITREAFINGMGATVAGRNEYHIHAAMDYTTQTLGGQRLAYIPVIASGRNGLALHYISNNDVLRDGDFVMVDGGAELHYYPTDCSRGWPVSGRFSEAQRVLYNAVLGVQEELITRCVPGASPDALHRESERLMLDAFVDIGLVDGRLPLDKKSELCSVLYPHSWGHFMGIDIHERINGSEFAAGMMHTVEPGVYVPCDDRFPERYHGIGFRIEDNVVIRPTGSRPHVTTLGIPKTVEEVEDAMARWGVGAADSVSMCMRGTMSRFAENQKIVEEKRKKD
eukprot:PhM_4_TR16551/c0_g1_i1/m.101284/K01262/pepP; Xaa-Pro aminopeptidase